MKEVKLEEVLFTDAMGRILDQELQENHKHAVLQAMKDVRFNANVMLNSTDQRAALLEMYDAIEEEHTTKTPQDMMAKLTCRKGCAHCCHVEVQVGDIEKDLIMEYVEKNGIKYNKKKLEEQLGLDQYTWPMSDVSRCVFLGADNTCNIYEVRPMSCRKYFVMNDPKFCNARKYPHGQTKVYFSYVKEMLASALLTASKKLGNMAEIILDKKIKKGAIVSLPDK
jgi:Fe-S-cluster containining protein